MTRTHTDPTIPTDQDALVAREVSRALENGAGDKKLRIEVTAAGRQLTKHELTPLIEELIMRMLDAMAKGQALSVVPTETEITTQQAADLLNVSRPYVVGLIDKGELPARLVGNQRRLPLADVLAYKTAVRAKAYEAMREIASIDQELGLK